MHTWCFPLKSKDQTLGHFKQFVTEVEAQMGLKIWFFRLDRGGEFMGKEFDTFLADKGIICETSAPDTPQQNSLTERMNQTIWSGVRALLHHSGMKNGFWVEALAIAVHVVNRSPRKLLEWRTPYKALTGHVPDVSHFHVFGCRAWVHNNKGKKLDAKSIPMIFVGYKSGSKAYRLWDPKSHRIVISSDIQFNEEEFPALLPPEPVTPIPSSSQDTLPFQWSEGASKKQVNFVNLPEIFALFNEEVRNQWPQVSHITPTTGTPGGGSMPAFTTPVLHPTRLPGSPDQRESEEEVSNDLEYQSSSDSESSSSSSSDEELPSTPIPTTFPTPSTPAIPLSEGYVSPDPDTGGKGSITQWVHAEYMVGSETICPTFTQQVRGGYFSKVPTKVPTG